LLQLLRQFSLKGFYFVFHLLPFLSDNTCLWLDIRICEQFWLVCWLFYLDSNTWMKISIISTYVTASFNLYLQIEGIHSAFTIYCELSGGKPKNKVRWTGSSRHHSVLHFRFGVKDMSCSLFNLLDLNLKVL